MVDHNTSISAPYENESESVTLGGDLNIENRLDRVSIFGSVELTRDKAGLALALALKSNLDAIVAKLQSEHLPEKDSITPPKQVDNPFTKGNN
ncbi:hypothetical protein [Ralstonia pseudosolanacearum]|uniref:hypothetical protein n=1 Tax=Ralstonia pseudosolanacearum TaxID=1310165 RepID=UPI003CE6E8A4